MMRRWTSIQANGMKPRQELRKPVQKYRLLIAITAAVVLEVQAVLEEMAGTAAVEAMT